MAYRFFKPPTRSNLVTNKCTEVALSFLPVPMIVWAGRVFMNPHDIEGMSELQTHLMLIRARGYRLLQVGRLWQWTLKYIIDPEFRLIQKAHAYADQLLAAWEHETGPLNGEPPVFKDIQQLIAIYASRMSHYGFGIHPQYAHQAIESVLRDRNLI